MPNRIEQTPRGKKLATGRRQSHGDLRLEPDGRQRDVHGRRALELIVLNYRVTVMKLVSALLEGRHDAGVLK